MPKYRITIELCEDYMYPYGNPPVEEKRTRHIELYKQTIETEENPIPGVVTVFNNLTIDMNKGSDMINYFNKHLNKEGPLE